MNLDALELLARGMMGENVGDVIEEQEARGQQALARASVLPKDGSHGENRAKLEAMGIQFHDDADDLFINVTLPPGWEVQPTEHPMHSNLVDTAGHVRASIFYKAAFYDRKASLSLRRRFCARWEPICGYGEHYQVDCETCVHRVYDEETAIWQSEPITFATHRERWAYEDGLRQNDRGEAWLTAHYPDWEDVLAYWDLGAIEPTTAIVWKEER